MTEPVAVGVALVLLTLGTILAAHWLVVIPHLLRRAERAERMLAAERRRRLGVEEQARRAGVMLW